MKSEHRRPKPPKAVSAGGIAAEEKGWPMGALSRRAKKCAVSEMRRRISRPHVKRSLHPAIDLRVHDAWAD
jgi:hypothetical protein